MNWKRSILVLLIGAWIGMTVATWFVATNNFRSVDTILDSSFRPEFAARIAGQDHDTVRVDFRYYASELNRWMFARWSALQVGFSIAALLLLAGLPGRPRWTLVAAVILALFAIALALGLTPSIRTLGRSLDFVPRPFPVEWARAGRTFGLLHGLYVASDMLKAALLAVLWVAITRQRGGRN